MAENTQENILDELDLADSTDKDNNEDTLSLDTDQQTEDDFDSLGLIPDEKDDDTEVSEESEVIDNNINDHKQTEGKEPEAVNLVENSQSQTITEEIDDEKPIQQKQSKIKIILISIIGLLLLIVIVGAILFFTGFFEPEVEKTPIVTKDKKNMMVKKEVEKYKFMSEDINVKRLNRKLTLLTKYEIIENDDKELLKSKEKSYQEKLKKEKALLIQEKNKKELAANEAKEKFKNEKDILLAKNKKLENDLAKATNMHDKEKASLKADAREIIKRKNALLQRIEKNGLTQTNKEELVKSSKEEVSLETKNKSKEVPDSSKQITMTKDKTKNNSMNTNINMSVKAEEQTPRVENSNAKTKDVLVYFIEVKTVKNVIYNSFIKKIETAYNKIELCRDDKNKIEVFVGPFENIQEREMIIKTLQSKIVNKLFTVDLTKEEYLKRCKY